MKKGKMFIVSGPGGVGKNTIVDRIVKDLNDFEESLSMTTREKRKGEVEGLHYIFLTRKQFEEERKQGNLLECVEFFGNLYGTSKKSTYDKLNKGINTISIVEVKGAKQLIDKLDDLISIFIKPKNMEILEKQLRGRGTNTEEYIVRRLKEAENEIKLSKDYTHVITNYELEDTINKVKEIITK